ncbi:hypothetical protein Hanom_Chr14g01286041 [Helianthus anomalus]
MFIIVLRNVVIHCVFFTSLINVVPKTYFKRTNAVKFRLLDSRIQETQNRSRI